MTDLIQPPPEAPEFVREEPTATERARRALLFFERARPGKRFAAVAALHLAMTGHTNAPGVYYVMLAFRGYVQIASGVRARVRDVLVVAADREPDATARAAMRTLHGLCCELEGRVCAPQPTRSRGRRRRRVQ